MGYIHSKQNLTVNKEPGRHSHPPPPNYSPYVRDKMRALLDKNEPGLTILIVRGENSSLSYIIQHTHTHTYL